MSKSQILNLKLFIDGPLEVGTYLEFVIWYLVFSNKNLWFLLDGSFFGPIGKLLGI